MLCLSCVRRCEQRTCDVVQVASSCSLVDCLPLTMMLMPELRLVYLSAGRLGGQQALVVALLLVLGPLQGRVAGALAA